MKILDLNDLKNFSNNTCVTLGFFDGMHLGHQHIFNTLINECKNNNYKSVDITFDDSSLNLFKMTKNINSLEDKFAVFEQYGIDYIVLLKTKDNFMNLTANQFIETYLNPLNCKCVICGSELTFAKNKEGNMEYLLNNTDYKIISVDDVYVNDIKISSTYIRKLITQGQIDLANSLLYKPFSITSSVINGHKIGRSIGFKTANIKVNDSCNLLKHGVYFGKVIINNKYYKSMINVGINPTVNIDNNLKIEAHILDFDDEIYNDNITIIFNKYHREEISFKSLEELKKQLDNDLNILKTL